MKYYTIWLVKQLLDPEDTCRTYNLLIIFDCIFQSWEYHGGVYSTNLNFYCPKDFVTAPITIILWKCHADVENSNNLRFRDVATTVPVTKMFCVDSSSSHIVPPHWLQCLFCFITLYFFKNSIQSNAISEQQGGVFFPGRINKYSREYFFPGK